MYVPLLLKRPVGKTYKIVNNKVSRTMVKILTHGRLTLLRLMTIN